MLRIIGVERIETQRTGQKPGVGLVAFASALGSEMSVVTGRSSRHPSLEQGARTKAAAWQRKYRHATAMTDTVSVASALGLAHWARFDLADVAVAAAPKVSYTWVSLAIAAAWLLVLAINGSRSPRVIGSGAEEYRRVWVGTLVVFGSVAILSMLLRLQLARGYLLIALPAGLTLLMFCRWLMRRALTRARARHGLYMSRLLVVGSPTTAIELAHSLARESTSGYQVVGVCLIGPGGDPSADVAVQGNVPVFDGELNLAGAVTATSADAVAVAATESLSGRGLRDLSWELEKLEVDLLVSAGVVDIAGPRLHMRPVAGLPLIQVDKPQYEGAQRLQKRLFDIVFSVCVLTFGFPAIVAIAIAVKLTSSGPVFYRQERIGLDGRPFEMVKFRTMVVGADALINTLVDLNPGNSSPRDPFKFADDPRVTRVGRLLRKYSIDEIPQFLNVLWGDMSVVGPRPQVEREVNSYDDYVKRRLLVRPGITGLWQVSGRSNLSWEDSMRLDLFYVENWSMMADLLIAAKTARAVLSHSGAY
jgi:exopolysaccharide biosynthesis polyprenyl glycosylphosphotransferase